MTKFGIIKDESLEIVQDFHLCRNFLRIWLTVSGVTPRNEAISFSVIYCSKSGLRSNKAM